ncbi:XTP/dITP diphosphatase, partial [Candidatus Electronema sp. TJ]|uniref:XTP/dITP diphosphatase n=1 Tax=Candidatus Electronema sp. TJ TaxID=3401573 RepID=UPI003AA937E6
MNNIIVLATSNENKVKELRALLKDVAVDIRCLKDFGPMPEAVEDGTTFEENAYKKALHYARILGLPALADDSGLSVDALDGAPGVYSARYSGEKASDWDNCEKLLREMEGRSNRAARFECVLSLAVPHGPALTWEGRCEGRITEQRRGETGFGYDPVFLYEDFGRTFAEVSMEEKSQVSHRGRAMREFAAEIDRVLTWLNQRMSEIKPPKPDHAE